MRRASRSRRSVYGNDLICLVRRVRSRYATMDMDRTNVVFTWVRRETGKE